jgi:hypothetical protein
MFEVIMLLAFLWAATSQLLPRKPVTTRGSCKGKGRLEKTKKALISLQVKRSGKRPAKIKGRDHSYAHAADQRPHNSPHPVQDWSPRHSSSPTCPVRHHPPIPVMMIPVEFCPALQHHSLKVSDHCPVQVEAT